MCKPAIPPSEERLKEGAAPHLVCVEIGLCASSRAKQGPFPGLSIHHKEVLRPRVAVACFFHVYRYRRFNRQHPPDPMTTAGGSGLPLPGFFLHKSFDGPQAFSPSIYVSFFYV